MERHAAVKRFLQRLQADSAFQKELEEDPAGVVARETGMTWTELEQQVFLSGEALLIAPAGPSPGVRGS